MLFIRRSKPSAPFLIAQYENLLLKSIKTKVKILPMKKSGECGACAMWKA
jgi:hypothetical protein